MRERLLTVLRGVLAPIVGYLVIAAGTIITFNVLVGQVTVSSPVPLLIWGTIGAVLSGIAGGIAAGLIAPRAPVVHALAIWILIAIDTAFVIRTSNGPVWFDLAGSSVLACAAVSGAVLVARYLRKEGVQ